MVSTRPEAISPRGMVLRASLISSLMKEPVSQPPKAKKMVDQKMAFFRSTCGRIVVELKCVRRTVVRVADGGECQQDEHGGPAADGAETVNPLAEFQSDDI